MGMGGIAINNSEKLLKNKKKLSGKTSILSGKCQGILNGLQCGNPVHVKCGLNIRRFGDKERFL